MKQYTGSLILSRVFVMSVSYIYIYMYMGMHPCVHACIYIWYLGFLYRCIALSPPYLIPHTLLSLSLRCIPPCNCPRSLDLCWGFADIFSPVFRSRYIPPDDVEYACVSVAGSSRRWSSALCELHESMRLPHLTLCELHGWLWSAYITSVCYHSVDCTCRCVCICSGHMFGSVFSIFRSFALLPHARS